MTKPFLLGVLGGMGPLATLDFQRRLLDATPAQNDRQQIPSVVWNVPQIADRQKALAGSGPSPLPQLIHGIEKLNQAGASHIAIPCNTAHHWYDALSQVSDAPILHIVDAAIAALAQQADKPQRVGIIATQGTLEAGWYQRQLAAQGWRWLNRRSRSWPVGLSPAVTRSNAVRWKRGRAAGAPGQRAVHTRRAKADSGLHRGSRRACGGEGAV